MGSRGIQYGGLLLEILILAVLLLYGRSVFSLLTGIIYLIVAGYPSIYSLSLTLRIPSEQNNDTTGAAWDRRNKAYLLVLAGWQVAIVGLLNMWPFDFLETQRPTIVGYLLVCVFVILTYRVVAMSDKQDQDGGSKPIGFFGCARSRRILFSAVVYTPTLPLIIASLGLSDLRWCPDILRPPEIWLLLVAVLSVASAILTFQRYHAVAGDKHWRIGILLVTSFTLGLAAAVQILLKYDITCSHFQRPRCPA